MKPKFQNPLRFAMVSAIAFSASLQAANLTWDTAGGDGPTFTAGSGNWDTSTTTWNDAGTDVAWSQTSATVATNAAIFAGADGSEGAFSITLTTGVGAQSLTFSNTGYALSAAAARILTVSSTTSPITVASGKSASIGGNVTASFSATGSPSNITGGGTLKISGTGAIVTKPSNLLNIIGGTTVNVGTSGLLTTSSQLLVGTNAGSGILIIDGGAATSTSATANHNLILANASTTNTSSGTLTINSGSVTHPAISGGLRFGSTTALTAPNTATGTLNLNGGQLTVARLYEGSADPGIISNVNFNGGKLIVRTGATNAANFMASLDAANVLAGGAKIDTNGVDTTIAQALLDGGGGGGLTKQGNGILTVSGANTYTGATIIEGGKLNINAPYNSITATTINTGARLRVTTAASQSTLPSVTVNTNGGFESNVGTYAVGQLQGLAITDFDAAGDYKVDLAGTGVPTGDITVLTYTNKTGSGVPSLGTLPFGIVGTVEDNGSSVIIHAQQALIWTPGTGDWDTSTANWTGLASTFSDGSPVAFPEIAGTNTVTLTAARSPSSVSIANNSSSTYTFTGSAIAGSASVAKSGTGVTTFNVANSYTGATTISGGAMIANANAALGSAAGGATIASGSALGLTNGVTYSTAEPITGSGVSNTAALGEFVAVQRGLVQAVSGSCSFAGPIEINAAGITRFGTQNGASLTLSGPITMASGVTGVQVLIRTGLEGDFVTLANSGNNWDLDTVLFTGAIVAPGGIRLATDNALPTAASIVAGGGSTGAFSTLDMNGNDQSLNGFSNSNGRLRIVNSDAVNPSTLTLNPTVNKSNYTIATNLTVIEEGGGLINLVKEGPFTQTLHDPHAYTGSTTIKGGSLQLGSFAANPKTGSIDSTTSMTIAAGANFDVSFLVSYAIPTGMPVTLKLDPTDAGSAGRIKAAADFDISSAIVTLEPVATLDDPVYVLAEFTSLTGTPAFATLNGLPSGYTIDYAHNGGTQIALVQNPTSGFASWISTFPAVGLLNQPGDDADSDGLENILEFVLNGNPTISDSAILPSLVVTASNYEFTFNRRDDSLDPETTLLFQYGTDLTAWTDVTIPSGNDTVGAATITVSDGSPADSVKVSIPKTEAGVAGKLIGRLKVIKP